MSHELPDATPQPTSDLAGEEISDASDAFIVRVRRAADAPAATEGETLRCRLIHVGSGRHLPCTDLDQVAEQIRRWLRQTPEGGPAGLR